MTHETRKQKQDKHAPAGTSRSVDPMLDLPQIDLSRQEERERHLLRVLRHEDYHGVRRYLAKPAGRD
jgi:hypothetical protein